MKKLLLGLILTLCTTIAVNAATYDQVSSKGKPVVVMFHQHGCGACKQLSPLFDKIASKFSDKFSFAKDDIHSSKIVHKFNFDTVPQVYIVDPKTEKGKNVDQDCIFDQGCFENALKNYK